MENANILSGSNKDNNKDVLSSCVRCKQLIKVGLKCIRCGRLTHKACVKLSKSMTVLDSGGIICCGDSSKVAIGNAETEANTVMDIKSDTNNVDSIRIGYLEEIIKQKDLIIMNQTIAINALKDQISLLKQQHFNSVPNTSKFEQKKGLSKSPPKIVDPTSSSQATASTSTSSSTLTSTYPAAVSVQDVSKAIHVIEARRICDNVVNIESDINLDRPARSRKNRSVLIGSGADLSSCPFKAASLVKFKHFHVTNLDVDVNENELCSYLKSFAPNVAVKKLQSRNPDRYSSFKVSVPHDEVDNIQVAEIWPKEVVLNHFFRSKRFSAG